MLEWTTSARRRTMKRLAAAVLGAWGAAAASEGRVEDQQLAAVTRMMHAVNAGDARSYASLYAKTR